jgi:hypothetical protein
MKTMRYFKQASLLIVLAALSMNVDAQRGNRDNNENTRPNRREEATRTDRNNPSNRGEYSQRNDRKIDGNRHDNNNRGKGNDHYSKKGNNGRGNDYNWHDNHSNKYKTKHHKGNDWDYRYDNHRDRHNHGHTRVVYHRHLPAKRYFSFHLDGCDYYHCGDHFYRYYPGYGYAIADVSLNFVTRLPFGGHFVIVENSRYYQYHDRYYIPWEHGYLMVPAPARPTFSVNVNIR